MSSAESGLESNGSFAKREARRENLPWLLPAAITCVVVLVCIGYWPTMQTLLAEWLDTNKRVYTHGPLVTLVALGLLMRANWGSALNPLPRPRILAGLLVAALLLGLSWAVAFRAGIQIGHQALLPPLLIVAIWSAFGNECARRSLAPVLILYSAIPIWDEGIDVLQHATIVVVASALKLLAVPAYVSGSFVEIPSGVFEVADGCAGLHYFVVALTIAAIYGEVQRDTIKVRLQLLLIASSLAIVANWVRVFVVIVAGHATDMQHYLVRVDHYYFGWVLFVFAMIVFFRIANRLPMSSEPISAPPRETFANASATVTRLGWGLLVVGTAIMGPAIAALPRAEAEGPNVVLRSAGGWSESGRCLQRWSPTYSTADVQQLRLFASAESTLCAFSASYLSQQQGKELISYDNSLLGGRVEGGGTQRIDLPGGLQVAEVEWRDSSDTPNLLWYTYVIGDEVTTSRFQAQVLYGVKSLSGRVAASVFAVNTTCILDCSAARAALDELTRAVLVPQVPLETNRGTG